MKIKNYSANALNYNLPFIAKRPFNSKMFFSLDPKKLAQEVLLSMKKKVSIHPVISFNNIQVEKASYQTHFGMFYNEKKTNYSILITAS